MKNQNNILRLCLCCLIFSFQSCEERTMWDLQSGKNGQLVVEAILTNELIVQEVKLSQSYNALNGATPDVSDAVVRVRVNEDEIAFLPDDANPGLYKSEMPFNVINDLVYTLEIDWQGSRYTASSELSSVAPMPKIAFKRMGSPDTLSFANFAPIYNANQQAMYEMKVYWGLLSDAELTRAKMYFYTFSTVDVSALGSPPQEPVIFPRGSFVIAKKFGLNDDFASYLRALVLETQWSGGFFDGASASLPTNISNGGLGFFSTCAVVLDSLIAQ